MKLTLARQPLLVLLSMETAAPRTDSATGNKAKISEPCKFRSLKLTHTSFFRFARSVDRVFPA